MIYTIYIYKIYDTIYTIYIKDKRIFFCRVKEDKNIKATVGGSASPATAHRYMIASATIIILHDP